MEKTNDANCETGEGYNHGLQCSLNLRSLSTEEVKEKLKLYANELVERDFDIRVYLKDLYKL